MKEYIPTVFHMERGLFSIPKRVCSLQKLKGIIVEQNK